MKRGDLFYPVFSMNVLVGILYKFFRVIRTGNRDVMILVDGNISIMKVQPYNSMNGKKTYPGQLPPRLWT